MIITIVMIITTTYISTFLNQWYSSFVEATFINEYVLDVMNVLLSCCEHRIAIHEWIAILIFVKYCYNSNIMVHSPS